MENINITCTNCGCIDEELFGLTHNGQTILVCKDCAVELGYKRCEDCGEWVHEDEVLTVNPGTSREREICSGCADGYYSCRDCGQLFDRLHVWHRFWDGSDECICDTCGDDWTTCESCGAVIRLDDSHQNEGCYDHYCDDCWPRYKRSRFFHDYSYKPLANFHIRTGEELRKTLMFGVELEVDRGDDHNDLSDALGVLDQPIYMKHDGSLDEEGVEIVTHPCSLAYHTYQLRWKEITRKCRSLGYLSHNTSTCGLHIHVGRDQMGDTWAERDRTAGNLVILARKLWDELVPFTRRTEDALEEWAECPSLCWRDFDELSDEEKTEEALRTESDGRYQAVNLCNSNTVEFRLFRGTLKRDTIIASLQLVNNMTRYAMTHTPTECYNATWVDVIAVERFAELVAYCEKRNLPTT